MRKNIVVLYAMCTALMAQAENIDVKKFRYAGPYEMQTPCMIDSVDVNSKKFDSEILLESPLNFDVLAFGKYVSSGIAPSSTKSDALHLVSFALTNDRRAEVKIKVSGLKNYKLYVDDKLVEKGKDKEAGCEKVTLLPSSHTVVIKYLTHKDSKDSLNVSVEASKEGVTILETSDYNTKRYYNIKDVVTGERYSDVSISADGKFIIARISETAEGGSVTRKSVVRDAITGKVVDERQEPIKWMPKSNKYYYTKKKPDGSLSVLAVDPLTRVTSVLATNVPEGDFVVISPTENFFIYTLTEEGPKERTDVFQVIEPDDRQPGWRNRSKLAKYDIKTGCLQPLTYGFHNVNFCDISSDGKYLLMMKSESRLTKRPTTLMSLYRLNLETMECETLVEKDGFISTAVFSPDGKSVAITGSPEALGGVGKNVDEGQIPSMIDMQIFIMDIASKSISPVTKNFDPNVQNDLVWNANDGCIYFSAEDKDCVHLFRLDSKTEKIQRIDVPEEMVSKFDVAKSAKNLVFYGQSASNSDRLYTLDTKILKSTLVDDMSARKLDGVELGECKAWNYINSRGDTLCCRYYLPPHFDSAKKYPMIVNYYGGCSPTSRDFESRYPQHVYSAMGYVVLIVNPSGATGFGQKFSARHVDTAGEGVAEDIIESTKAFCKEHSFVNDKKIGCIGASYGGFMSQYLQTKTDIFAAAISHAGISDHTSYWGEGYWGYSYSEVSMANEYPWTNKKLYVDQSPLFNAEKIHTPILFLHGTADTNVPVGESIQLFTALKLLGRETAMVLVEGQDHHILQYDKRLRWQETIFAWFAKWLQDDSSWWEEMYGNKSL